MPNTEPPITLDTVIQRDTEHLLTSEVGEELVMMDLEGGNYISLNKIGRIIWEQIEQPLKVGDLIKALMARFKVSQDQCTEDTFEYLQNMLAQKVISVKE
jgi:hypothetical protein